MFKLFIPVLTSLLASAVLIAQEQSVGLMPFPKKILLQPGRYRLTPDLKAACLTDAQDDILTSTVERTLRLLNQRSRVFFRQRQVRPGRDTAAATLTIRAARKAAFSMGMDESYVLDIDDRGIRIDAPNSIGAARGLATLQQLLQHDTSGHYLPHTHIEDAPRYAWRGLMIDVARHFIPIDVIKRNIDAMAAVKMNVLHLHLTDDEGFRIESKSYPGLHEKGSNGQYFTQEQMREIIDYARLRGIMVVPEFDLPGHSRSWFAAYPELASAPGPYEPGARFDMPDSKDGNINIAAIMSAPTPTIDPTREEVYKFLDRLFTEMCALFPAPYFHIGADENNGVAWKNNPAIMDFMKKKGLKDVHALQDHFVGRLYAILKKKGKTMMGWEELYNPALAKEVVVQRWIPDMGMMKGKATAAEIAAKGNPVVVSQGFYTDLFMPAHVHYNNPALPSTDVPNILGGEAAQWTEIADAGNIERRVWPRAGVIAERLWSPADVKGDDLMYERMFRLERQLDEQGLGHIATYERGLRQLASNGEYAELKALTDVLVPVRGYKNLFGRLANPTMLANSASPLNGIGDIISTDPEVKRTFRRDVAAWLEKRDAKAADRIRRQLQAWSTVEETLKARTTGYRAYAAILPHAANLRRLSEAGLRAMDNISGGKAFSENELAELTSLIAASRKAHDHTELDIVPEIESLIRQKLIPEPRQYPLM